MLEIAKRYFDESSIQREHKDLLAGVTTASLRPNFLPVCPVSLAVKHPYALILNA